MSGPTTTEGMETTSAKKLPPRIHTYHCLCSELLLGLSQPLSSLPQRKAPGKDGARILPLASSLSSPSSRPIPVSATPGLARDPTPIIVEREDGYERRFLWKCQRCDLIAGYTLIEGPPSRSDAAGASIAGNQAALATTESLSASGGMSEVLYLLYLLESGLVSTEEMAAGLGKKGRDKKGKDTNAAAR